MFTGSFRLAAGTRHLHRDCDFTEPLVETAPNSLRHSCRSELTRQGISLGPYSYSMSRRALHVPSRVAACRHADGTISSSSVLDVRRMASEDSDQLRSESAVVHSLRDLNNLEQAGRIQM